PHSVVVANSETGNPLRVTFLHSLSSLPDGLPSSTHYGLSAGMIAARAKQLATGTVKQNKLLADQYAKEMTTWTEIYETTWSTACAELAKCFENVEAFLALPSKRTEVRSTLIACFSKVH